MDDIEINNVRDLIKVINKHKAGDRITMEFFRGPGKVKLKTVLEKAPTTQRPPMASEKFIMVLSRRW